MDPCLTGLPTVITGQEIRHYQNNEKRDMRTYLALVLLGALSTACFAGEIRKGATMQVKPNSIRFSDRAKLAHWQELKKSGRREALASYQANALSEREAWQFVNPLAVKILGYEPEKNTVNVKMTTAGRFLGTPWFLDADAIVR